MNRRLAGEKLTRRDGAFPRRGKILKQTHAAAGMNLEPAEAEKHLPENRTMTKHSADLSRDTRDSCTERVGVPAIGLLLILLAASVAFSWLVPKASGRDQGAASRVCWYLRSGQLQADVRTLAAALRYAMDPDPTPPARTNPPLHQSERLVSSLQAAPPEHVQAWPPNLTGWFKAQMRGHKTLEVTNELTAGASQTVSNAPTTTRVRDGRV